MQYFLITLMSVGIMLLYAVPGFVCVKTRLVKAESISSFAAILMYVCQPCLTVYSLDQADYTPSLLADMGIVFALSVLLQAAVLGVMFALLRRKSDDVRYRVANVAFAFGNCAFMGLPLLQAIYPDRPEVAAFSVAYLLGMNLMGWTVGSAIITRNKRYISLRKALINPATIALIVAFPLFLTGTKLPGVLGDAVALLGRMTTPLCMLIMGMRLATVPIKGLFTSKLQYATIAFKQIAFPLIGLLLVWFLPIERYVREALFIMFCTPVASVVLNFAELLGEGQETAANMVLLGTSASVVTIPLLTMLVSALP